MSSIARVPGGFSRALRSTLQPNNQHDTISNILLFFVESIWPFKRGGRESNEIHAEPLELAARIYESFVHTNRAGEILPGFCKVATAMENGHEYVIGYIENGPQGHILCPFINIYKPIKIRIDGDHANEFVPILKSDPLYNLLFKEYKSGSFRNVEIKRRSQSRPLISLHN